MTTEQKVFELQHYVDHLVGDIRHDAWLLSQQEGLKNAYYHFWEPGAVALPQPIIFEGYEGFIEQTDYPENKDRWPLMSRRMLDALLSVGSFPHQTIPVRMQAMGSEELASEREYIALQLLEHLDSFDWEKSIYRTFMDEKDICYIDKLVLKMEESSLPPIFRLAVWPTRLFVTAQARLAIEEAGCSRMDFLPVKSVEFSQ